MKEKRGIPLFSFALVFFSFADRSAKKVKVVVLRILALLVEVSVQLFDLLQHLFKTKLKQFCKILESRSEKTFNKTAGNLIK